MNGLIFLNLTLQKYQQILTTYVSNLKQLNRDKKYVKLKQKHPFVNVNPIRKK